LGGCAVTAEKETFTEDDLRRALLNLFTVRRSLEAAGILPSLVAHVQLLLEALENAPEMFEAATLWRFAATEGFPRDQEAMVILLVKVRWLLTRRESIDVVDELHARFIDELNGEPYDGPLWALLREEVMLDEHPRLLGDFARWVAREWPPT
jgi:hypothetical protein